MFTSYADLMAAVQRVVIRTGDAIFEADFSRQVRFAEQRINYGAGLPLQSDPVRVRGMEKTVKISVASGVATLPADYLEARRLTWDSDIAFPLKYRTPEEFWNAHLFGAGLPSVFTVEGETITLAPSVTGEATLTYYAKFEAVETEDIVTDATGSAVTDIAGSAITLVTTQASNWLMANAPAIVMNAVLIESWKFLRNNERAQEAYAEFVSAVGGMNLSAVKARTSMSTLAPKIRGARIP